jgi:hypothetical protein
MSESGVASLSENFSAEIASDDIPSSSSLPPRSAARNEGSRALSRREWELIEDISQSVRTVGNLFVETVKRLGVQSSSEKLLWRGEYWSMLVSKDFRRSETSDAGQKDTKNKKDKKASSKVTSKADALRRQTEEKLLEEDRRRAQRQGTVPCSFESCGGRLEPYVFAILCWTRSQRTSQAVVALLRAIDFLKERCDGADDAITLLRSAISESGVSPSQLLEDVAEDEELISRPLFRVPAQLQIYPDQREFVEAVVSALADDVPTVLQYCTPPSGGKTSATALLGALMQHLHERSWVDCLRRRACASVTAKTLDEKYVVYCCHAAPVRIDVCKHLVATNVPFAVVTDGVANPSFGCFHGRAPPSVKALLPNRPIPPDLGDRVEWSLSALVRCDRRPRVLVTDMTSCRALLEQRRRDVLLFDEPTAHITPEMRLQQMALLEVAPRLCVLLGATLPHPRDMISDSFAGEHCPGSEARLTRIESRRIGMSLTAVDSEGTVFGPHDFGASVSDIETDPHLLRFCSPRLLLRFVRQLSGKAEPPSLRHEDCADFASVREKCLSLLRTSSSHLMSSTSPREPPESIVGRLDGLCTDRAGQFPGCTLLLTERGAGHFEGESLKPLVDLLPPLRRLVRSSSNQRKQEKRAAPLNGLRAREELELVRAGLAEEPTTSDIDWPSWAVVNSREHLLRFGSSDAAVAASTRRSERWRDVRSRLTRGPLQIPSEVLETSNSDLVEALLCGCVLFGLDKGDRLHDLVAQTQAESARSSFVVSGRELIFGTNFPVDRVLLDLRGLDRGTLIQACGRAGRWGRAARAEVVFWSGLREALSPGPSASKASALSDDPCLAPGVSARPRRPSSEIFDAVSDPSPPGAKAEAVGL